MSNPFCLYIKYANIALQILGKGVNIMTLYTPIKKTLFHEDIGSYSSTNIIIRDTKTGIKREFVDVDVNFLAVLKLCIKMTLNRIPDKYADRAILMAIENFR